MRNRLYLSLLLLCCSAFYLYFSTQSAQYKPVQIEDVRYLKVDNQGEPMPPWSGPWACVLDKQQGLLWEVKTDDESIHDGYWTYSWFNGEFGDENAGDCYFEDNRCDSLDLINRTNQQKLCGVTGWRLPSRDELVALITHNDRAGDNQIASDYFLQIKKGDYWTSDAQQALATHYRHLKEGAIAVNFSDKNVLTLPYRNAAFVLLVNDNQPGL